MHSIQSIRLAGMLMLTGILAGVFSVTPVIDSVDYLTEAAKNSNQVVLATVFQLAMSFAYAGVAILLYPHVKMYGGSQSIGFLSFRIMAASLSIAGASLLPAILAISEGYTGSPSLEPLGEVFKISRDHINHVFMILALCTGNLLLYALLYKAMLIPGWLSAWGLVAAVLAISASILFLFRKVEVASNTYLVFNAPAAAHELVLGIWLMAMRFSCRR